MQRGNNCDQKKSGNCGDDNNEDSCKAYRSNVEGSGEIVAIQNRIDECRSNDKGEFTDYENAYEIAEQMKALVQNVEDKKKHA